MFTPSLLLALPLLLTTLVTAAPIFGIGDSSKNSNFPATFTVGQDTIDPLLKSMRLSAIAYCPIDEILAWNCGGGLCDTVPGIVPIVAGGDNGKIPDYFVAHDPTANSVIVAHQGTDPKNLLSIANDAEFLKTKLDPTFFDSPDSTIEVHGGFQDTFARTASAILGNVTQTLQSTGATTIEITGHSLGAAIAVMDAVFLTEKLSGMGVGINVKVYGLPRGGNGAWADFVDNTIQLTHVHNRNDPVSIVPPTSFGFKQPSGELHIQADNSTLDCPGQENPNSGCLNDQQLLKVSIEDHLGPYFDGQFMGNCQLPSN